MEMWNRAPLGDETLRMMNLQKITPMHVQMPYHSRQLYIYIYVCVCVCVIIYENASYLVLHLGKYMNC